MQGTLRTTTTTRLLEGLRDRANEAVWREFDARYRPMIISVARRLGLNDHDAADVAQEALACFVRDYRAGKYDPARGRLRAWMASIIRYRVADWQRSQAQRQDQRGDSAISRIGLPDGDVESLWDEERRRTLLRQALDELRTQTRLNDTTICAFELYALQERPAADVARDLGLKTQDVYMAKRNVAVRLRDILSRLEDLFDDR